MWEIWISGNDRTWKVCYSDCSERPYIQISLLTWILFPDLCPDQFEIWVQNKSPDRQTFVEDVRVSLVDKNGFECQLTSEEIEEEEEEEWLNVIFCADLDHCRLDWSKFMSPDGQLRIRIGMQIKDSQDSCSANQDPGGFSLGENWNCGDFTDAILVKSKNPIRHI